MMTTLLNTLTENKNYLTFPKNANNNKQMGVYFEKQKRLKSLWYKKGRR